MPMMVRDETIVTRTGTRDMITRLVLSKAVAVNVTLSCGETDLSLTPVQLTAEETKR